MISPYVIEDLWWFLKTSPLTLLSVAPGASAEWVGQMQVPVPFPSTSRGMLLSYRRNGGPYDALLPPVPLLSLWGQTCHHSQVDRLIDMFVEHSACARQCTRPGATALPPFLPGCFISFGSPNQCRFSDHFVPEQGLQCITAFQHNNTSKRRP